MSIEKRLTLFVMILIGGLAACKRRDQYSAEVQGAHIVRQGSDDYLDLGNQAVPGLTWDQVHGVQLPGALAVSGMVNYDPRRVATIVSRVQGRIEDTRVNIWDTVHKGDIILELYSPDFMTAEAEYIQAASSQKSSATVDGMADVLAVAARQKLTLLGASPEDIEALRAPEPTIRVRAPIGGTIIDNKVVRGSAINPGDALLTVGTLDEVWITADVYQEDASRLAVGQQLEAKVVAFPGETFRGIISNISPDMNPDTHTLQVRAKVANPSGKLKPRMLADVTILTRVGEALGVPRESLVFDTDGYYAFVRSGDGLISRRKVEIASWSDKGFVRIQSGLKPGEKIAAAETVQLNALWHRAKGGRDAGADS